MLQRHTCRCVEILGEPEQRDRSDVGLRDRVLHEADDETDTVQRTEQVPQRLANLAFVARQKAGRLDLPAARINVRGPNRRPVERVEQDDLGVEPERLPSEAHEGRRATEETTAFDERAAQPVRGDVAQRLMQIVEARDMQQRIGPATLVAVPEVRVLDFGIGLALSRMQPVDPGHEIACEFHGLRASTGGMNGLRNRFAPNI